VPKKRITKPRTKAQRAASVANLKKARAKRRSSGGALKSIGDTSKMNAVSKAGLNRIKVAESLGLSVEDAKKKMAADSRKIKAAQKAADKKKYAAARAAYKNTALYKKYK
jgi:hypothetical protein